MKQIIFWLVLAAALFYGGQFVSETTASQMLATAELDFEHEEYDDALARLDRVEFLFDWTDAAEGLPELREKIVREKREKEDEEERMRRLDREYEQRQREAEEREQNANRPGLD